MTGRLKRWEKRPKAWTETWQCLHHDGPTRLTAELAVEGSDDTAARRRSGPRARRTTTRRPRARRRAARGARLGPCAPLVPPVSRLRRAGDDVRHAVLAVRGADAGARPGRHRRADRPAQLDPARARQPAQGGQQAARRARRPARPRRRACRARGRRGRRQEARPRRDRAAAGRRARLQRRHRDPAPPRGPRAADRRADPRRVRRAAGGPARPRRRGEDRRDPRDQRRGAVAKGASGPRPGEADRRLPRLRHARRAR